MKIQPFKLERYFAKYEFSTPHLLCCSDCEPLTLANLLSLADNDSMDLWNKLQLGYTESQGHPILREEITQLYSTISPDQTLVITPEEGIFIAMNTMLEPGDHIITTFPGYQSLYEIAGSLNCQVSKWTPEENNGWTFDINNLQKLIQDNTKLVVINFPHNPTGATISRQDLKKIINIARDKNIIIFSDEIYRFLEHDDKNRLPSASDLYDNAISLFGMSKSFALAGLRIGWLTTKNSNLFQKFAEYKDYTTICSSAPSEILAIMALRAKEKVFARNLGIIKNNLLLLDEFFVKHKNIFQWHKPKVGPITFPKLKGNIKVSDFCLDLAKKKGVLLLPSEVYDYKGNNFRLGFARKNMPQSLDKLEEYIKQNF